MLSGEQPGWSALHLAAENHQPALEMASTSSVQRQYNRWAGLYDRLWHRYIEHTVPVVVEWAAQNRPQHILDVGCGTGAFETRLLQRYTPAELVGVDLSEKMLKLARHKLQSYTNVSFLKADAAALPLAESRFDCAVSASTLHYVTDPNKTLVEIYRVLKPGGRLIILDWCRDYWTCQIYDRFFKYIDRAHQRCYTQMELQRLLHQTGFQLLRSRRFRFDLVWGIMISESVRPGAS